MRVQLFFDEESSLTQQSFKDECDVNVILGRYGSSALENIDTSKAIYGDFSEVRDYRSACDMVIQAEEQFMLLPASLRVQFGNDPAQFLEFVDNPQNKDEMVKLGLIKQQDTLSPSDIPVTETT